MGLVTFFSCICLLFILILLFKKRSLGRLYLIFGVLTAILVGLYISIKDIPNVFQSIVIFIIFSLIILLFGLIGGTIFKIMGKSNNKSSIASVIMASALIIFLINSKVYISYVYIPVILYKLQGAINIYIDKFKKASTI